ncbi:uncharacterized protein VP01_307g7 [Puccinia sorghi]|uniref:Smr domain-containing protein n=1 Tax=Puccinia sorghi TaxID=27349 RepID=A0A0L6UZP8_9BASI|nr:uncharacterized protein VP01_307g7 [Puccinia sorghi]
MAFHIQDAIGLLKKFKRWWDRTAHQDVPSGEPPATDNHHQPWGSPPTDFQHQDHNQINSQNPHFVSLRNQAIKEGNLMKQKFDEAHRAYDLKDGARAKSLSNQGKAHQERRNQLNKQAAEWIFKENNRHVTSDTIDLHGLYVQESLSYAENFINQAEKNNGSENLRIIVGKGLHSQNFQAKLKPAIEKLVKKHHLAIDFDNHNAGVLLVRRNVPNDRVGLDRNLLNHLSSDTNHSGKDDGCIIV